jgi:hypothetical protein
MAIIGKNCKLEKLVLENNKVEYKHFDAFKI